MGSIVIFFTDGGPFMYVILLVSIFGLAISLERLYFLMVKNSVPARELWQKIMRAIKQGDIKKAIAICDETDVSLARILKEGLKTSGKPERVIQNTIDEKALEQVPLIDKRIHYISMLANVSTLLGLLGTILGLIQAFAAVAHAAPAQKAALLANGISIAMNTTAFGLIVAVPLVIAYTFLQSNANRQIDEVDEFSVRLINLLAAGNSL